MCIYLVILCRLLECSCNNYPHPLRYTQLWVSAELCSSLTSINNQCHQGWGDIIMCYRHMIAGIYCKKKYLRI